MQDYSTDVCFGEYYNQFNHLDMLTGAFHPQVDQFHDEHKTAIRAYTGDSLVNFWLVYDPMFNVPDGNVVPDLNSGIYGNTTCHILARYRKHVVDFNPQYVFFDGGGNDLLVNVPYGVVEMNVMGLIRRMRDEMPNTRIVYMGIPPSMIQNINDVKQEFNNDIITFMHGIQNSCFIDMNDVLAVNGQEGNIISPALTTDGIHWKPIVYTGLKERVNAAFYGKTLPHGVSCF